ncbi:MAG: methylenetetrahydrofolate reductase, partial [Clostridiales bacterium]|nr:methylenetetrahydrofolate reductase [Clostridiales bacterium]
MKISKLLASEAVSISIEMFPPKECDMVETTKRTVAKMAALNPSFMSVTYGASGGTSDTTVTIADTVQNVNGIPA